MNKNGLCTALENIQQVLVGNLCLTLHDDLITLNGYNFAGILINEVLVPALQHTCCQLLAYHLLQGCLVNLHLLSEVEDLQDVLIGFEADGTKKSSNRQLLLTVNISIHDIVNVRSKLNP